MKPQAHDATTFVETFARPGEAPPGAPLWLRRMRERAHERFLALGLPHPRMEEWRRTNVAPIAATAFRPLDGAPAGEARSRIEASLVRGLDGPRLVLVNGRLAPELSTTGELAPGVVADGLARALAARPERLEPVLGRLADGGERAFTSLNTARFPDGVAITAERNARLEQPITVIHVATGGAAPGACFPRLVVAADEGASLTLVEAFLGDDGPRFSGPVTEIDAGPAARVTHYRVQDEGPQTFHVGELAARLARGASVRSLNVCLGARLARCDIGAVLAGEGAEAALDGLYVARGEQHVDNHTVLDHAAAHCPSHELYKGILSDRARAVFNGRIIVREGAQKTNAIQSNKSLLLSPDATVHTRPQLEIYADDVKCTHGATIGQLDRDALFYLRTRGIGAVAARNLLIRGFASDLLQDIEVEPLRAALAAEIVRRLPA